MRVVISSIWTSSLAPPLRIGTAKTKVKTKHNKKVFNDEPRDVTNNFVGFPMLISSNTNSGRIKQKLQIPRVRSIQKYSCGNGAIYVLLCPVCKNVYVSCFANPVISFTKCEHWQKGEKENVGSYVVKLSNNCCANFSCTFRRRRKQL